MLKFLRDKVGEPKFRLLKVACCPRIGQPRAEGRSSGADSPGMIWKKRIRTWPTPVLLLNTPGARESGCVLRGEGDPRERRDGGRHPPPEKRAADRDLDQAGPCDRVVELNLPGAGKP